MKVICKLKQIMDADGLSQLEVAEATGLSPTTVGKLYRNQFERIDKATLITLCQYFRKGIGDLFEVIFEEGD
jgi:putative transcriptional regulator